MKVLLDGMYDEWEKKLTDAGFEAYSVKKLEKDTASSANKAKTASESCLLNDAYKDLAISSDVPVTSRKC